MEIIITVVMILSIISGLYFLVARINGGNLLTKMIIKLSSIVQVVFPIFYFAVTYNWINL